MKRFDFVSPEVMYAASRIIPSPFVHGRTDKNVVIRRQGIILSATGLLTHDAGDRVIVTAGDADVDRMWRRAHATTRACFVREHALRIRSDAWRDEQRLVRRARALACRDHAVVDEDLAAFTL